MSEHAYLDHGPRHLPEGSDPIPGLAGFDGLPFCDASFIGFSMTSGTSDYVPITGVVDSGSGIFSSTTGSGGQTTVEITAEGIYIAFFRLDVHMSTAPAAGSGALAEFQGGYYPMVGGNGSLFYQNPTNSVYGVAAEHTVLWNLVPSYGNIPMAMNVIAVQNSGTDLTNQDGHLFIVQVNPHGNDGF